MADRDVLICGTCSSQFSDLKLFIDHKQTCGNASSSSVNNTELSSIISHHQQTSHIGSQQIPVVIPSAGHASIVSLPVGMPHVILQTTSGLSQMYRIVLEPSLNTPTQISPTGQVSQASQISTYTPVAQTNSTVVDAQYAINAEDKNGIQKESSYLSNKMEMEEDEIVVQPAATSNSLNEATMTRLSAMAPVDSSSWTSQRTDQQQRTPLFEPMITNVISEKNILEPISVSTASNLHTDEEDVATFLATQLVSQSAGPQQHPKFRGNNSDPKYCNEVPEPTSQVQENLNFVDADSKDVEFSVQAKSDRASTVEKNGSVGKQDNKEPTVDSQQKGRLEVIEKGIKKLACNHDNCKFITQHKKDMVRHMRKHTGEKPFSCSQCMMRFSRQDKLKVHQRIHSKERPYACSEPGCSYRGNEKAHLRKHLRTHTNERPYRCQFCQYSAKDVSHLTVHLRSHTGDSPFHCETDGCSATFKTSSDLKRHEKLHSGDKPFKCTECDYKAALKSNLKVHFRINHLKGERYGCKSCPFLASTRKQFKEHEKCHATEGQHPGKNSRKLSDMSPAVISKYSPTLGDKASLLGLGKKSNYSKGRRGPRFTCPKNFRCDRCGSAFVREDSFRSHIRQHDRKKSSEAEKGVQYPPPLIDSQGTESSKGKIKSVCTLNYVFQGTNGNLLREIPACNKGLMLIPKQGKLNQEVVAERPSVVDISPENQSQETPSQVDTATTTTSDSLSSYMIAIDGISSMYSNPGPGVNFKSQPSVETAHVESHPSGLPQDDPVVHVITSSSVNTPPPHKVSLLPTSIPATSLVKVIPPRERVNVNMEENLT